MTFPKRQRLLAAMQLLMLLTIAPPIQPAKAHPVGSSDYVQCAAMLHTKSALMDEMETAVDRALQSTQRDSAGRAAAAPYEERIQRIDADYAAAGCP